MLKPACFTHFVRRLLTNPSFYGLISTEPEPLRAFLEQLVNNAVAQLQTSCCVNVAPGNVYTPLFLGHIVSKYYLSHLTARAFTEMLGPDTNEAEALRLLASCEEYVPFCLETLALLTRGSGTASFLSATMRTF